MPAQPEPPTLILFGPFEADLQSQELRRQGLRLHLPRQSFQILKVLLERPGVLVTREELRQALWPSDTFVDFEHGLNAAVNRLRECLGDDADQPRYVETLPRRGYRLIAPVDDHRPLVAERSGTIAPQAAPPLQTSGPENIAAARRHKWGVAAVVFGLAILLGLSAWKHTRTLRAPVKQGAKPSAAVLPFKNLSADPENEYFSDGMTEEIITKLSCIHGLAVASHTSVVRFKTFCFSSRSRFRRRCSSSLKVAACFCNWSLMDWISCWSLWTSCWRG